MLNAGPAPRGLCRFRPGKAVHPWAVRPKREAPARIASAFHVTFSRALTLPIHVSVGQPDAMDLIATIFLLVLFTEFVSWIGSSVLLDLVRRARVLHTHTV
jgi:hypothetical protein